MAVLAICAAILPCNMVLVHIQGSDKMSEANVSGELARLRALVADYETKLTDAATLVASLRHEINNPLAALWGQVQLLLREDLGERARERVEKIAAQVQRIQGMVGALRDIQTPAAAINREPSTDG